MKEEQKIPNKAMDRLFALAQHGSGNHPLYDKADLQEEIVLDGIYHLREIAGRGGMSTVFRADVDLDKFDYSTLLSYAITKAENNHAKRKKATELLEKLQNNQIDAETLKILLEAQQIPLPPEQVAVKVAGSATPLERFQAEWQNLMCMCHQNVIKVFGGGIYQRRPYYSMEFLSGLISSDHIRKLFTLSEKLEVIIQAGKGLTYLHRHGIVHRDIKPDNLLVSRNAEGELVVKITDLGIAKNTDSHTGITLSQSLLGTPHYMAPEQIVSTKDVDHQADVYALGATLYDFVTGMRPYHNRTTLYEIISTVSIGELPIEPNVLYPALPEVINNIIQCAMSYEKCERYQSMNDFIADLERYLAEEDRTVMDTTSIADLRKLRSSVTSGNKRYLYEKIQDGSVDYLPAEVCLESKNENRATSAKNNRYLLLILLLGLFFAGGGTYLFRGSSKNSKPLEVIHNNSKAIHVMGDSNSVDLLDAYEKGRWQDLLNRGKWLHVKNSYRLIPTPGNGSDFCWSLNLPDDIESFVFIMRFKYMACGAIQINFDKTQDIIQGKGVALSYKWAEGLNVGDLSSNNKITAKLPELSTEEWHTLRLTVTQSSISACLDDGAPVEWHGKVSPTAITLVGDEFIDWWIESMELQIQKAESTPNKANGENK